MNMEICNNTLNTLDMEMNTKTLALSKVDLHISDPFEPITTTLILNHQSWKWRLNNSLQHLSELFGDGDWNSLHDLLQSPSLYSS
jgi:hypothetical protein